MRRLLHSKFSEALLPKMQAALKDDPDSDVRDSRHRDSRVAIKKLRSRS